MKVLPPLRVFRFQVRSFSGAAQSPTRKSRLVTREPCEAPREQECESDEQPSESSAKNAFCDQMALGAMAVTEFRVESADAAKARRSSKSTLNQARSRRMLWPAPTRMALIALPLAPARRLRSRSPSLFVWPIIGSMALRRRSSRLIVGVRRPGLWVM